MGTSLTRDRAPRAASATRRSERGVTLIETAIAIGVMGVGALGIVGVLAQGVQKTNTGPGDLIASQKAQEAVESVFAARDSRIITWAQLRNVAGASGSDNGIFLDGPQAVKVPGPDGLVGTVDDGAIESYTLPGRDGRVGTSDDEVEALGAFTREIVIRDIQSSVRAITVTVSYQAGSTRRRYTLTAYISNYA